MKAAGYMKWALACASAAVLCAQSVSADTADVSARIDSISKKLPIIEQKAQAAIINGASRPVALFGYSRLPMYFYNMSKYPAFMGEEWADTTKVSGNIVKSMTKYHGDNHYLVAGSDGADLVVGLVVQPNRFATMWSDIGFALTFPGRSKYNAKNSDTIYGAYTKDTAATIVQQDHYAGNSGTSVLNIDNMNAGVNFTGKYAAMTIKFGTTQWMQTSPLTVWGGQPRNFAWEYPVDAGEETSWQYYQEAMNRGLATGSDAWNKRAFSGINLETQHLPADFYFNFMYGHFSEFDCFEREYLDLSTDLGYTMDAKYIGTNLGYGDSYRHVVAGRLAKLIGRLTLGANYSSVMVKRDIVTALNTDYSDKNTTFNLMKMAFNLNGNNLSDPYNRGFYKEPKALSIDLHGAPNDRLTFAADIAASRIDTTYVLPDSTNVGWKPAGNDYHLPLFPVRGFSRASSSIDPAVYGSLTYSASKVVVNGEVIYAKPGFYSPFSSVNPINAFIPFGSNMLEGSTFLNMESTPYVQNMAGALVSIAPKLRGEGHIKISYGYHAQIKAARDLIYFPYRLNGPDIVNATMSSYNKFGFELIDYPMQGSDYSQNKRYARRLGDESYFLNLNGDYSPGPEAGGLRADQNMLYEGFVPYLDSTSASENSDTVNQTNVYNVATKKRIVGTDTTYGQILVPTHQKTTFNLDLDASYNFGKALGSSHDFYLGGYATINGISGSFDPSSFFSINEKPKDKMLWSVYGRFEPAVSVTPRFYLVGLLGYENWRGANAWMYADSPGVDANVRYNNTFSTYYGLGSTKTNTPTDIAVRNVPIDYRDYAVGLGFDWDIFDRAGLHTRVKMFGHRDVNYPSNDWKGFMLTSEIRYWF